MLFFIAGIMVLILIALGIMIYLLWVLVQRENAEAEIRTMMAKSLNILIAQKDYHRILDKMENQGK